MGILYLIAFVVYIVVAVAIYKVVKQELEDKWASRLILAFLILLPTYDIIITKALLFYYCNFTETEKVYRTVENPESVYFEDKIIKHGRYDQSSINMEAKMYLIEYHTLKSIEFYNGKNSILHYEVNNQGKIVTSNIHTPLAKYHVYRRVRHINSFVDNFLYTRNIIIKDIRNNKTIADLNTYNPKYYNFMFMRSSGKLLDGCENNIYRIESLVLGYTGTKKDKWSKDGNK